MTNGMVSVIIPVYNSEKYLSECLKSVANQSYHNIEIILIDDGSHDNSGTICDEFAAKDERIKVIHKENGGVSSARNVGLAIMSGEYVTFVDSDDYIKNNMIEQMLSYQKNNDADVVQIAFDRDPRLFESESVYDKNPKVINGDDNIKDFALGGFLHAEMWGKLYRSSLFDNFDFDERFYYAEDLEIGLRLYKKVTKSVACDEKLYFYRISPNSQTETALSKGQLEEPNMIVEAIEREREYKWLYDILIYRYTLCVLGVLNRLIITKRADLYAAVCKNYPRYKTDVLTNNYLKTKHKIGMLMFFCIRRYSTYSFFAKLFYKAKNS